MSKWLRLGFCVCLIMATQAWASIGKVSLLKGEAVANRDNQTITLFNGTALEKHDIITTQANSQLQLTFEDKTVITLGSESILDIQDYFNDAQEPRAKFKFKQGTFKSITGSIGKKAPAHFNLETKTATIGIRGTTVIGQTNMPPQNGQEQPDIIGCSSGRIVVITPLGSVDLDAGFATNILPNQAPTPPRRLSPSQMGALLGVASPSPQVPPPPAPLAEPSIATQATQTHQQTTTTTSFTDRINDYSDGYYPVFNPPLLASSTNDGMVTLSGLGTSQYLSDEVVFTQIDTEFNLALDTANDSLSNTGDWMSTITLNTSLDVDPILNLAKASNASEMTYKNSNRFSIKNFDAYKGWIQTENTYPNDYVSWGYWSLKANNDELLLPTKNYWVAGKDVTVANEHIESLIANSTTTSYAYSGHVIGSVTDGTTSYSIDPTTNNAVQLNFDFGGGSNNALKNSSYITFQTVQATPNVWKINPSGSTLSTGNFNIQNTANVSINEITDGGSSSTLKGQFYGATAQAVGGTLSATASGSTATGVFKATR